MPGVDKDEVEANCRAALRQTLTRDAISLAALTVSAILRPWPTFTLLGLIVLAVALIGRIRIPLPVIIAAATGAALAIFSGGPTGTDQFMIPVFVLLICFLTYTLDAFLACRKIQKLLRKPVAGQTGQTSGSDGLRSKGIDILHPYRPFQLPETFHDLNGHSTRDRAAKHHSVEDSPFNGSLDGKLSSTVGREKAYYNKRGIVGAGTPLVPLRFTVPLDKPLDATEDIEAFKPSQLLGYIAAHIQTQGTEGEIPFGYARRSVFFSEENKHVSGPKDFTYGLPHLKISAVVAVPLPKGRKRPFSSTRVYHVQSFAEPMIKETLKIVNRSPSEASERHYVRASTTSWDGQLIASIYVAVALQGHYLRVITRPYVLAPIVSDLKVADDIAAQNIVVHILFGVQAAIQQTRYAVEWIRRPSIKRNVHASRRHFRGSLRSMREHYAQDYTDSIHHIEDLDRLVRIMEMKVIRVTSKYLRIHNIDVEEAEGQVLNFVQNNTNNNTLIGSGNVTSGGTVNSGPVTNVSGQGNTATAGTGTASGK